jgi:hypothetical protein
MFQLTFINEAINGPDRDGEIFGHFIDAVVIFMVLGIGHGIFVIGSQFSVDLNFSIPDRGPE